MRDVIVVEFVSLDGVMQAPGNPSEDPDGFDHGGWTRPFFADHARYIADVFRSADTFVMGRVTYEIFAGYWPSQTDPDNVIATALNGRPKYVASTSLESPDWSGTTIIRDDLPGVITSLKTQPGGNIVVVGSSQVAQTLWEHGLVDEVQLWLHPVVLGGGKRLFPNRGPMRHMRLIDATSTTSGLVILTYRPVHAVIAGSTSAA